MESPLETMSASIENATPNGLEKIIMSEEQQAKFSEIRQLIGTLPDTLSIYYSDASISRCLSARNWNVKKATKMLKDSLKWRAQYKPEEIRWEEVALEAETGKIYRSNYVDKFGRTVLVMRPSCQGFNLSHISVKVTRETAHVLQDHYPERLGLAILYNPPKFFEPFWTVVKPFLEPKTCNKVKFVYSDNTKKIMEDLFDMEQLETSFGGNNNAGFDINKYTERMKEDDKKLSAFWRRENPPASSEPLLTIAPLDPIKLESGSDVLKEEKIESSESRREGIEA